MNLNAHYKNIEQWYKNIESLPEDQQPFAETLKKAEIKKLTEKFNKKKGKNKSKLLNYEERLEELMQINFIRLNRTSKIRVEIVLRQ